jgi:hypothetical protein
MNQHTCIQSGDLYTCPACDFRAVQTTDGRVMVTQPGDAAADHTGMIATESLRRAIRGTMLLLPWLKWMREAGLA